MIDPYENAHIIHILNSIRLKIRCVRLSRSIFLYFNFFVSATANKSPMVHVDNIFWVNYGSIRCILRV